MARKKVIDSLYKSKQEVNLSPVVTVVRWQVLEEVEDRRAWPTSLRMIFQIPALMALPQQKHQPLPELRQQHGSAGDIECLTTKYKVFLF
jgi:hypothetical protein